MTSTQTMPSSNLDRALLVLRVVVGIIFIMHGYQKVFSYGIPAMVTGFTKFGVPLPAITAPFIAILELVAGIGLALGLFGRVFAVLLMCDMLGAMIFVHFKNGFFLPTGYEFTLILAAATLALALTGPGQISADAMIARRR
jgi:putative oxidoreductase